MIACIKAKNRAMTANFSRNRMLSQHGFTLIELLVALVISSVIAIAAISALIVSRQGFSTVDAASQLRDNSRFAVDLIQRLALQSGFKDIQYAAAVRPATSTVSVANITGYNNQKPDFSVSDPSTSMVSWGASEDGKGSDVLILRYQPSKLFAEATTTDKSMINCMGAAATFVPLDRDDRMTSIFYINTSLGEPSLMCAATTANNNTWPSPATGQPIISGVENMQILYGVESVTANTAPAAGLADTSFPNLYLRADQMVVAGNADATNLNWQRVRSIRIGMVLRGPLGSAQESTSRTLYPLGQAAASSGGAAGSAMSSTTDVGTVFVTPTDTRLRQVVTFTVHLRNEQGI
jgi:type IV pilus assembly protein PilW